VIDSDASFSVVSRSTAERLGLRILPDALTILTTARPDQPMQLAIADRLVFGDAELAGVVFAVLPDSAVRFGPSYRMEAVVGLPVLVALGRIAYDRDDRLEYGRGAPAPAMEPNLVLSGLDPFVLVPSGDAKLRLAVDTAADKTSLNASVWTAAAVRTGDTRQQTITWRGAGGSVTDRARVLGEWRFVLGSSAIVLKNVAVQSRAEHDRHGALGLDALKGVRRWVLDFDAMCFWLEP
jgi:hypothetical protein